MNEQKQLPGGWFNEGDIKTYRELIERMPDNGRMLELGTWKGRSLCSVSDLLVKKNIKVFALDSFEGTTSEGDAHKEAKSIDLQEELRKNLTDFGSIGQVVIIKGMTLDAVNQFTDSQFDLIFVDADHTCKAVYNDIHAYWSKLKDGGIMSGHDWSWDSVKQALKYLQVPVINNGDNMWHFEKKEGVVLNKVDLNRVNFSVCFIGRNEEKTLPTALKSLEEFKKRGGQVCYLDTGSTDKSAQVARDWGCTVEEVGAKFITIISKEQADAINKRFLVDGEEVILKEGDKLFDFASARNYCANNLAKEDMIAWLDCDEGYTAFNIDKIIEEINNGVDQFEYEFVFSHDEYGLPMVQFIQSKFHNKKKIIWAGIVHEILSGPGRRMYLPGNVFKNEHWQNPETNRGGYLSGLALDCFLHQEKDRNSHYFARELMWRGRPKSAIKEFERHLTIAWWNAERAQSMIYIGNCNLMLGNKKEGVEWLKKAFDEDSGRREALIRLAEFYYREKDWQKCACYAAASLEIPWSGYYANNKYHYEHIPHELLAEVEWYLNNKAASKINYDKCLEFQPYNARFLHDYRFHYPIPKIDFVIPTLGRPEGLERCVNSIKKLNYPQEFINIIIIEDEPRMGVPKRVKEGFEKGDGEYVVYASNDCEFTTNSLMIAYLDMKKKGLDLCSFNTGDILPDEGNINEHFIIRREFVKEKLNGEIFDTRYYHLGCDNILWARTKKRGKADRCNMAKVNHYHFSTGKAPMDEVYKLAWQEENIKHDRELLKEDLSKLYEE